MISFKEGEILRVDCPRDWKDWFASRLRKSGVVEGFALDQIDEIGMPRRGVGKPMKIGSFVMFLGAIEQTTSNDSLVRVLYEDRVYAIMWECLKRPRGKSESTK